ncbi:carbon-nitrogen hydrolase family protein [Ulvibacterium sp.]|uniref:carbon-nitrogen hydrolase family protein n=1 Tax=Ulvibacterium sp. TaxID=2665914 RepID=UPI0026214545|nr:carbon-nitrogen hydrolase family protein [Ulvibacterium sp.]
MQTERFTLSLSFVFLVVLNHTLMAQSAVKKETLHVGIGQMHVNGGNPEVNLKNATLFIKQAAENSCDVIVLPECLDFGWTNSSAINEAQPIPGDHSKVLQEAAKENAIYVVAGLTERDGNQIHNTALLISPNGQILGKHRKVNILDIARHIYTPGMSCTVTPTDLGMIGMNICADNSPATNELGHALGYMGADIILSPCSWAVPPDYDNEKTPYGDIWKESYTEIAQKHHIPVIGVSNTGLVKDGEWKGWWCIGASLVVSKDGEIQKQFAYTKEESKLYTIQIEVGTDR